ncbi:BTAD domain-containing putative transcriptional regulator [Kribbella sp. NPDC058693]|uniref:nSTAND1 domain-containing NTPase n=1 Tax=Kribbella sp. NPDC058693 TaxID=3346602 RepID=UPI0036573A18
MGIAVLGPLTIEGDHTSLGRRDRAVLAALAVRPGEVLSAAALADAVWGERPPASWSKNLQGCMVRLRKSLGGSAIETSPQGYRLAVPLDDIDARRFERAVGRARELLAAGDSERSATVLADALMLWRGQPLDELDGWDPARTEAARLTELHYQAEELYVEAALRSGQHVQVLAKAQALVAEAQLRERRWVLLATAQYQDGRQSEALRTIRRLRAILDSELGLDPSAEVESLEQAILRQDPSLVVESALPEPSVNCPYLGLRSYDVDDADGFFGRDADVAACLRKLAETSILAVVGPSGCGKSSLVRAGVAASLRRDGTRVVLMTPGAHPVAALATAIAGKGPVPALLVDQCEEVFSLCQDAVERDAFLTALTAHQGVAPLILSFRADRLADVSAHPAFARMAERGLHLLAGMAEPDLRAAIEQPARLAALVVEPGLVDLLVNEVADQPGALPLMSHALAETWSRREGRHLTVAGYTDSGGIRGAVAQSAEQVYERLPTEQRGVLRDLLLRLVTPGLDGEPVRSRHPRRLVVTGPDNDAMIDRLVAARLVTSDDGVVELAHESLARAWPRLRDWLDDDLEGQRVLHHLANAADSWNGLARPDSELYRGVRLAKALDWRQRTMPTLTATEKNFLDASKRLSEAELHAAEDRERRQLRVNRRLRAALGTAAALMVGALIAGLVAVRQADRAEQAATSELARGIGARAQPVKEISHAILLAAQSVRLADTAETRALLTAAMNKNPQLIRSMPTPSGRADFLDVSPDGTRIIAGDGKATLQLYDAASGRVLRSRSVVPDRGEQVFIGPRFSPDGRLVAAIAWTAGEHADFVDAHRAVRLLNADTLEPVSPQPVLPSDVDLLATGLAFSANGRFLAAGLQTVSDGHGGDGHFGLVWDLRAPGAMPRRVAFPGETRGVMLSPDGRTIYGENPLAAYDVATGRPLWRRPELAINTSVDESTRGEMSTAQFTALDARGGLLGIVQYEHQPAVVAAAGLIDARTGRTIKVLRGSTGNVAPDTLIFSGDASLLAVAESSGDIVVWDVATGTVRERITSAAAPPIRGLDFSPDNETLYAAGQDGLIRVYDLTGRRRYLARSQVAPARHYLHVVPSDDGSRTAYLWRDGNQSWGSFSDTKTGAMTAPTRLGVGLRDGSPAPVAWHPDGRQFAVNDEHSITTIDASTGKVLDEQGNLNVLSMAYIDGDRILTGDPHGPLIYDKGLWPGGREAAWTADCCTAAAPDGTTAVIFQHSPDGTREHWRNIRTDNETIVSEGDLPLGVRAAAYSPDGRIVAVTGTGGQVLTIDTRSGQFKQSPAPDRTVTGLSIHFSQDGSRLVSGAADGTVSVWDTRTLEQLGSATITAGRASKTIAPIFAEGNDTVAIAASDGSVYRWDTRIDDTLAFACRMAGRNLTPEEWKDALGDRSYVKTCP